MQDLHNLLSVKSVTYHVIVKLHDEKLNKDWWMLWSSILDAPYTYGLSKEDFLSMAFGEGLDLDDEDFRMRIERTELTGTSELIGDLAGTLACNRAKQNEYATLQEILENMCRNRNWK